MFSVIHLFFMSYFMLGEAIKWTNNSAERKQIFLFYSGLFNSFIIDLA
jgi:uncharacterized membrane protein